MTVFEGIAGLREGRATGPGGQIHYWDTGEPSSASGPPVALLHGTGGSAESHFVDLLPMLAFRRRVIAVDYAPRVMHSPDLHAYSDNLESALTHCEVRDAVAVVGHSLGAAIATTFAASYPHRASSLVLVAGWLVTDVDQRLRQDIALRLWEEDRDALARFLVFTSFGSAYLNRRQHTEVSALITTVRERLEQNPTWAQQMHLNRVLDISREADSVTASSLVVGAKLDRVAPLHHSKLLFGAIEDARYVEVSCGHSVPLEHPAELHWLIEQFTALPAATPSGSVWESRPLKFVTSHGTEELALPNSPSRRGRRNGVR